MYFLEGRRKPLLSRICVRNAAQLTPKAKKMYRIATSLAKESRRLRTINFINKDRIKAAKKMANAEDFFGNHLNETALAFMLSQIRQNKKKSRGRRYSIEDKIFALSLLKQSPKCYKLLRKTFALPSRKTLLNVIKKVPFNSGISSPIFKSLKKSVARMKEDDKHCVLMFDEMTVEASLHYDASSDIIEGFEDCGFEKKPKFADHVMVFMVRGLRTKWKQPIAYFFSEGGMKTPDLTRNVQEIIRALQQTGLHVICTVCDQYSTNSATIAALRAKTEQECLRAGKENTMFGFAIDGEEVIPIYDPPHLLKGIRNNMLHSNVKFEWKHGPQIAKWDHIRQLYDIEGEDFDTKICYKLTEQHVNPEKIPKMKVKNAAQVFSHTVSATMRAFYNHGEIVPAEFIGTADFILFVDKLFDSVNGSMVNAVHGKRLRTAVTATSEHTAFYREAIKVLESIRFYSEDKADYVPPSIKNFITTLRGFLCIWAKVHAAGFKFLCPRNVNQDPIENFFGCIRSHGARNINPSCTSFTNSFKSLIINNFGTTHSPGSNCEEDDSAGALDSLKHFITEGREEIEGVVPLESISIDCDPNFQFSTGGSEIALLTRAYLAGYVAKKVFKIIGRCATCRTYLISDKNLPVHDIVLAKAYSLAALLKPTTRYIDFFGQCCEVAHHYLPKICHETNIATKIKNYIELHCSELHFPCVEHNFFAIFNKIFVKFYIYTWVRLINNILCGKLNNNINDIMKQKARTRYIKYRTKKMAIQKLKHLV